jgi:hypothetical protein
MKCWECELNFAFSSGFKASSFCRPPCVLMFFCFVLFFLTNLLLSRAAPQPGQIGLVISILFFCLIYLGICSFMYPIVMVNSSSDFALFFGRNNSAIKSRYLIVLKLPLLPFNFLVFQLIIRSMDNLQMDTLSQSLSSSFSSSNMSYFLSSMFILITFSKSSSSTFIETLVGNRSSSCLIFFFLFSFLPW